MFGLLQKFIKSPAAFRAAARSLSNEQFQAITGKPQLSDACEPGGDEFSRVSIGTRAVIRMAVDNSPQISVLVRDISPANVGLLLDAPMMRGAQFWIYIPKPNNSEERIALSCVVEQCVRGGFEFSAYVVTAIFAEGEPPPLPEPPPPQRAVQSGPGHDIEQESLAKPRSGRRSMIFVSESDESAMVAGPRDTKPQIFGQPSEQPAASIHSENSQSPVQSEASAIPPVRASPPAPAMYFEAAPPAAAPSAASLPAAAPAAEESLPAAPLPAPTRPASALFTSAPASSTSDDIYPNEVGSPKLSASAASESHDQSASLNPSPTAHEASPRASPATAPAAYFEPAPQPPSAQASSEPLAVSPPPAAAPTVVPQAAASSLPSSPPAQIPPAVPAPFTAGQPASSASIVAPNPSSHSGPPQPESINPGTSAAGPHLAGGLNALTPRQIQRLALTAHRQIKTLNILIKRMDQKHVPHGDTFRQDLENARFALEQLDEHIGAMAASTALASAPSDDKTDQRPAASAQPPLTQEEIIASFRRWLCAIAPSNN